MRTESSFNACDSSTSVHSPRTLTSHAVSENERSSNPSAIRIQRKCPEKWMGYLRGRYDRGRTLDQSCRGFIPEAVKTRGCQRRRRASSA
jgi:hypothetical protein